MIDTRTLLFQALVLFMSLPANFSKMFKRKEVFVKRFSLYYSPLWQHNTSEQIKTENVSFRSA